MDAASKLKISRVTLLILMGLNSVFLVAAVVIGICVGFGVNPFQEGTTSFLIAAFTTAIGLSVAMLFLNIAANLSVIADRNVDKQATSSPPKTFKRWAWLTVGSVALAALFVGIGSSASDRRVIAVGKAQAEAIFSENPKIIDDLIRSVREIKAAGDAVSASTYASLDFLQKQRADIPQLTVIVAGTFSNQPAMLEVRAQNDWERRQEKCTNCTADYYQCRADVDCGYLAGVFRDKSKETKTYYDRKKNELLLYFPVEREGRTSVLLFSRSQRYGKFGSL